MVLPESPDFFHNIFMINFIPGTVFPAQFIGFIFKVKVSDFYCEGSIGLTLSVELKSIVLI